MLFRYACCSVTIGCTLTVAIFEDPGRLSSMNYVCIVAFAPDLQRASFYSVTKFLPYSITTKLLPLHNTHERFYRALEPLYDAEKLSSALCLLSRTNSCKAAIPVGPSERTIYRFRLLQNNPAPT